MLKQLNIRLEDELIKKVKVLCIKKDVNIQDTVKSLLELWVKDNEV